MRNLVNLSGSIAKKEVLVPIESNIMENTFVCEASSPYANYYGQLPQKPKPNSIFLFTQKFYFLEEILSFSQHVENNILDNINIASAVIAFQNKQYPAIRIKNFENYSQLASLQLCLANQGIEFAPELKIIGKVQARINKLFVLEEMEPGIYMDLIEENKGYFIHDTKISPLGFEQTISSLKNNSVYKLFDAVQGEILLDGNVLETVRVFAEGLRLEFIKSITIEFRKQAIHANIQVS